MKGIGGYTWPGIRSESCTDGPLVTTALGDVTMAVLVAILAPVAAYRLWTTAVLGVVVEFSDSSCAITVTSPLLSSGIVSPTLSVKYKHNIMKSEENTITVLGKFPMH